MSYVNVYRHTLREHIKGRSSLEVWVARKVPFSSYEEGKEFAKRSSNLSKWYVNTIEEYDIDSNCYPHTENTRPKRYKTHGMG